MKMKFIALGLLLALPMVACNKPADSSKKVMTVSLSGPSEVQVGATITIEAAVSPSDATNKSLTWSVNNTSYATISQSGVLTGIAEGTVVVTATSKDGSNVSGSKSVTVKKGSTPVPGDTITVAQAITEGNKLADKAKSAQTYKVHGYVSNAFDPKESTQNPGQFNFDIVDTQGGDKVVCWWLNSSFGLPKKGAEITVQGYLQKYGDKIEVVDGSVISQGGGDTPVPPSPSGAITVSAALTEAKKLAKGATSTSQYTISGYVSNDFEPKESTQTPGQFNFDIVDTQGGDKLICWWLTDSFGKPTKGSAITVKGYLQNYNGKYEVVNGSVVSQGGSPTPTPSGDRTIKNVADDVARALGQSYEEEYDDESELTIYSFYYPLASYSSGQELKALQDLVKKLPSYLTVDEAPAKDEDEYGEFAYTCYYDEESDAYFECYTYIEDGDMMVEAYVY